MNDKNIPNLGLEGEIKTTAPQEILDTTVEGLSEENQNEEVSTTETESIEFTSEIIDLPDYEIPVEVVNQPGEQEVVQQENQEIQKTPETSEATKEQTMELEVTLALEAIRKAIVRKEEDPNQDEVIDAVQRSKSILLDFATLAYIQKPNNPKMLESITSLIAQIEKTVRDDRKEKEKAKDREDDKLTFNQMLEAMAQISSGKFVLPTFDIGNFVLDPSKSLIPQDDTTTLPITQEELTQGNEIIDLDGNKV